MPGGRQNPLSVTNIVEQLGNAVNKAKDKKHEKTSSLKQKMSELGLKNPYVDLSIKVSQVYNKVESSKLAYDIKIYPSITVHRCLGASQDGCGGVC